MARTTVLFVLLVQATVMITCAIVVSVHVSRIEHWLALGGYPFRSGDHVSFARGPFQGRKGFVLHSPTVGVQLLDSAGVAERGGYIPIDPSDLDLEINPPAAK